MSGFPPICQEDARVLILGSMPSAKSLSAQQYYAHPRNSFWWIMANISGFDEQIPYPQRCQALKASKIAVWDVLHDCQRPGSLDSDIVRSSEQPNDFQSFFNRQSKIQLVAFNGGAAKSIFRRHSQSQIRPYAHLQFQQLPSTSPAYASMSRADKLQRWKAVLSAYLS